ncbi:hypothetical protein ACFL5V_10245 [Fibrobacterota bacterium]
MKIGLFGSIASLLFSAVFTLQSCYSPEPFELPELVVEVPYVAQTDIAAFLGTSNAKLVFTKRDPRPRIFWSDLNRPSPTLIPLRVPADRDNYNADSPLISPDGNWVAYTMTGGGGAADLSKPISRDWIQLRTPYSLTRPAQIPIGGWIPATAACM